MDQHQPVVHQAFDDIVDHPFPTEEDRAFLVLERTQAGIGLLGQQACAGGGGGEGAAALRSKSRGVEPGAERTSPVGSAKVETGDTERRDVDRQRLSRPVEHSARRRGAARADHPLAFVHSNDEEVVNESLVAFDSQERQRVASLGRLDSNFGLPVPGFEIVAADRLGRQRCNAVPLERALDLGASGFGMRRRVEIEARRPAAVPSGGRRPLRLRLFDHAVPQLAQAFGEPDPQPTELLIVLLVIGLPKLKATRVAGRGIVEREAGHRVAALVQQELGPGLGVRALRLDHEHPAVRSAVPDLRLEPLQFVLAPARLEIAFGHDDDQDAASARLRSEIVGEEGGRVEVRIHPDAQSGEFGLERAQPVLQPDDEVAAPIAQRGPAADRGAVRVADENVRIETRREIRHRRSNDE